METALILPILIVLFAGTIEISMLFLARQTLSKLSAQTADMIAQSEITLRESDINDVFAAMDFIAGSQPLRESGRVIVSGVIGTDQSPTANEIAWQRCVGALESASDLGAEGDRNITLPGGIILRTNEMAVLAEVTLNYQPLIFDIVFSNVRLSSSAIFRPRFGALAAIENDLPPALCI